MPFRPEPSYAHGSTSRTAVLLVNLGSPDQPTAAATRRYLAEFLTSQGQEILVKTAMRYGNPAVPKALDELRAQGATRVLVLPLYPQYAAATTASVWDSVAQWSAKARQLPEFRFVNRYGDEPALIQALAASVRRHWDAHGRADKLVMSFHGLPERSLHLGDPYHCECHKSARLLAEALDLPRQAWQVTFQSRFGKAQWLRPYTEPTLKDLAKSGIKSVDVICPGFSVDCLETLEEIAQEARDAFLEAGGTSFRYIPCLNDDDAAVQAMAQVALRHLQGWPTTLASGPEGERALQRRLALEMGAKD